MAKHEKMTSVGVQEWLLYRFTEVSKGWLAGTNLEEMAERIPYTDYTAAIALYDTFKDRIHYIHETKSWFVWNGIYHEKIEGNLLADWMARVFIDNHNTALRKVKEKYLAVAAGLAGDDKVNKMNEYNKYTFGDHRKYRNGIHSSAGISGLTKQIMNRFSFNGSMFNDDTQWVVFKNGVLDLYDLRNRPVRPGGLAELETRLLPHDPARGVYRCIDAELRAGARNDAWMKFMATSQPDPELREFLAVMCGAALLGENRTKTIPVLKGPKDSGKSVFINTMLGLFGGYGDEPDTKSILITNGPNFEQDKFRGLRFAGMTEPSSTRKVDDSFLKKFTGGDYLSTRNLHERSLSWKSQGILFIATNIDLKFNSGDEAIRNRFAYVEFPNKFYHKHELPAELGEEFLIDAQLEARLANEHDGILSWILNGALMYLMNGTVHIPEAVKNKRTRQYVEDNPVHLWAEESVLGEDGPFKLVDSMENVSATNCAKIADLYADYQKFCYSELNADPISRRKFSAEVQAFLAVERIKSGDWRLSCVLDERPLTSV